MIPKRAALALVLLLLPACDEAKPPVPDAGAAGPSALVAPHPPPASSAPPSTPPSIGVPECDEYFKFAFDCEATLPPDLRAKGESDILKFVPGWSALAKTPANRAELIEQCTKVLANLKASPACRR